MPSIDLKNNIDERVALNIQAISTDTTTNGVIIDTQGYESVTFIFQAGTLSDGTYTPLIQDGDDSGLSDAAAVSDTFLIGTESAAALDTSNTVSRIGYVGKKRYVRFNAVSASTSSGGTLGAVVVLGSAKHNPVS